MFPLRTIRKVESITKKSILKASRISQTIRTRGSTFQEIWFFKCELRIWGCPWRLFFISGCRWSWQFRLNSGRALRLGDKRTRVLAVSWDWDSKTGEEQDIRFILHLKILARFQNFTGQQALGISPNTEKWNSLHFHDLPGGQETAQNLQRKGELTFK